MKIFIPGNVPSSKNSKRWTGKMLINSKTVMNYIKESKGYYLEYKNQFKKELKQHEYPVKISFKFIRKSKHKLVLEMLQHKISLVHLQPIYQVLSKQ